MIRRAGRVLPTGAAFRDLLDSATVAALVLSPAWAALPATHPLGIEDSALLPGATRSDNLAALVLLAAGTLVSCILITAGRTNTSRALSWGTRGAGAVAALLIGNALRSELELTGLNVGIGTDDFWVHAATLFCLVAVMSYVVVRFGAANAVRGALRILMPLAPILVIEIGLAAVTAPSAGVSSRISAPDAHAEPSPRRVVVMVFDQLDAGDVSRLLARGLLPGFAALQTHAVVDTAEASAGDTVSAVPSMLSGETLVGSVSGDQLLMESADGSPHDWLTYPDLFMDLAQTGLRTGVAGWYLPYCRLPAAWIAECYQFPLVDTVGHSGLRTAMIRQLQRLVPWHSRMSHIRAYQGIRNVALAMVADPNLDFVFIHWPIPHGPGIYDSDRRQLSFRQYFGLQAEYEGNLRLVDRTIVETLSKVASSRTVSERTILVVTGDHGRANRLGGRVSLQVPFYTHSAAFTTSAGSGHVETTGLRQLVNRIFEDGVPYPTGGLSRVR